MFKIVDSYRGVLVEYSMKTHKLLAIVAFALALIGGILVAASALGGMSRLSVSSFFLGGFELLLALGAVFGGWLIYVGARKIGGMLTLIAGIIILLLTGGFATNNLLIIAGGVLGLVAAEMKPWWAFWR